MLHKKNNNITMRFLIYILGVAILALGVVLNTKTNYGVSPVNSVPYSLAVLSGIELGNMTIICYLVYVIIEMFLMKKNRDFQYSVFLQIPFGVLFGKFVTFFNHNLILQFESHIIRVCLLILAVVFTAIGISLSVNMRIIPIPPDGLTDQIGKLLKKDLGQAKNIFDILSILLTVIICVICRKNIIGIGVGTIFAAIFIGRTVKFMNRLLFNKIHKSNVMVVQKLEE